MSIITITIVLNICQDYFSPMAAGWRSALFWVVFLCLVIPSHHQGSGLCASVVQLCVRLRFVCVFVSMNVWSESGVCPMISAGSLSEAGLGLGDINFNAVRAFCGGILSYWRGALCRHQPFPGFLPLLVHSWVHAPVLPRWQLGFRLLLWHRWWKLFVFILREKGKEWGARWGHRLLHTVNV